MKCELTQSWEYLYAGMDSLPKDIYFTENYAKLYENNHTKAFCFIAHSDTHFLFLPILVSEIDGYSNLKDFETPYGYGGPIANTSDQSFLREAETQFIGTLKKHGIIAGLIRFHPLIGNHLIINDQISSIYDRKTVYLDLEMDSEGIWRDQIHSKHRNSIRKARELCTFKVDYTGEYIDEFIEMYIETMKAVDADAFYLFDKNYFKKLFTSLKDGCFLGLVFLGSKPIAGAIFLYSGIFGHYHLSGSLNEYRSYSPNNFLIYSAMGVLKKLGVRKFHLGGGADRNPENTLLKFKKRFSKTQSEYHIGKVIVDQEKYEMVCSDWSRKNLGKADQYSNILLKYRF